MNSSTDRFTETTYTSRVDRDEDGFPDPPYSAAGPQCENCGQTVDRISWVEGWDYWGCDDCHAEAVAETARELVELASQDAAETLVLLAKSGCTLSETAAYLHLIGKEVA